MQVALELEIKDESRQLKERGGSNDEIMLINAAVTSRMKGENEAMLTDADIKFPAV